MVPLTEMKTSTLPEFISTQKLESSTNIFPSTTISYSETSSVESSTTSSLSASGFSASDSGTVVYIATRDDKVTSFNGYICELIVYNQTIGLTAQQRVEGYLAWKWGLQANLPGAHPYYSAAP